MFLKGKTSASFSKYITSARDGGEEKSAQSFDST